MSEIATDQRRSLSKWINGPQVEKFTTFVICLNLLVMAATTYMPELRAENPEQYQGLARVLDFIDSACLIYFAVEVSIRLFALRRDFFKDGWNVSDLVVVGASLLSQHPALASARILRVLRLFMLMSKKKTLRLMSLIIIRSIAACSSISVMMLMIMSVFAIFGSEMYGAASPELFGNFHRASYTLFKVSFLFDYDTPVEALSGTYPWIHAYLIPYFLIMSCVMVNFFATIMLYIMYDVSLEELQKGELSSEDKEEDEAPVAAAEAVENVETALAPAGVVDAETLQRLFAEIESLKKLIQDKA